MQWNVSDFHSQVEIKDTRTLQWGKRDVSIGMAYLGEAVQDIAFFLVADRSLDQDWRVSRCLNINLGSEGKEIYEILTYTSPSYLLPTLQTISTWWQLEFVLDIDHATSKYLQWRPRGATQDLNYSEIEEPQTIADTRKYAGDVALISGWGRRMGTGMALELISRGASAAIYYANSTSQARETVKENNEGGNKEIALKLDISKPDIIVKPLLDPYNQFGRLNFLASTIATEV